MTPAMCKKINPVIIRAISVNNAFYCRGTAAAALVFELCGWKKVPGDDPYLLRRCGGTAVYFPAVNPHGWVVARELVSNDSGKVALDVRTLICSPFREAGSAIIGIA